MGAVVWPNVILILVLLFALIWIFISVVKKMKK